jgi:hypothetical protein
LGSFKIFLSSNSCCEGRRSKNFVSFSWGDVTGSGLGTSSATCQHIMHEGMGKYERGCVVRRVRLVWDGWRVWRIIRPRDVFAPIRPTKSKSVLGEEGAWGRIEG